MAQKRINRNRAWLAGLVVLLGLALGHGGDLEIQEARVIHTPEGNFLELALAYPKADTPLTLTIVVTPMGDGVLEVKSAGGYRPTAKMPIPYGVSLISDRTRYRIRLPEDTHKASGPLSVTLFFPGGGLVTVPASIDQPRRPWPLAIGIGALLAGAAVFSIRKRLRSLTPGRIR